MKTSRLRLARLLAGQTLKKGVSKRFDREIAAYLLSEGRTNELDSLLRDVQADWAENGHVEVTARSAHPLTAAIRADIRREVKKIHPKVQRIVVNETVDPEVVGGVQLNLPNRQLDLSIRSKLNMFKQSVTAGKE
ncbi:MAG TPA: F0F1 ATP synthase subunit delta [Candidatus Saccharimonadales bacterium]|nr:F0F1 ATP synthase subunit delta [Candidatus Saccharimonadales bacterium]